MGAEEMVAGLAEAERRFGRPAVRRYDLDDWGDLERFWHLWARRQAEVVLVLRRPDGCVLLQTKSFYPEGAFRLPSGGVDAGEDVLEAAARETMEETGLEARVERFLGVLEYRFRRRGEPMTRTSYVFELAVGEAAPEPQDESENITEFREVPAAELSQVAAQLEGLAGEWVIWGRFRALAHWFVAETL